MNRTIGTCSLCGGAVTVPDAWLGVIPPVPTCSKCGATAAEPHGPVIPMKPAPKRVSSGGTAMTEEQMLELARKRIGGPVPFVVEVGNPSKRFPVGGTSDTRKYRDPLTRVGPVMPGSLRRFEGE